MFRDSSKRLPKDLKGIFSNRPIKIAFVVPFNESESTHKILDCVFEYSYKCWGGSKFILLPATTESFLDNHYIDWMDCYDADIIYSYVDLDLKLVTLIETRCSPAQLIYHDSDKFCPRLYDVTPIGSISTIHSNDSVRDWNPSEKPQIPRIITQCYSDNVNTFIPNNFGTSLHDTRITYGIPDLFETICLNDPSVSSQKSEGLQKSVTSIVEIIDELTDGRAYPISRLSSLESDSIGTVASGSLSEYFNIFVGKSTLDRIHFWNSRACFESPRSIISNLIIPIDTYQNADFLSSIGKYLDKRNFIGQSSGPPKVALRSHSLEKSVLIQLSRELKTHNIVTVPEDFSAPSRPENCTSLRESYKKDSMEASISHTNTRVKIHPPKHLSMIPPKYSSDGEGHWGVEMLVDREKNHSHYINTPDCWMLPRRQSVTQCFDQKVQRITVKKLPMFVVGQPKGYVHKASPNNDTLNISMPSDIDIFEALIRSKKYAEGYDLRYKIEDNLITHVSLSDKGMSLKGLISMFNDFRECYQVLTHRYWREVLEKAHNDKSAKRHIFSMNCFEALYPKDSEYNSRIAKELSLKSPKNANPFIEAYVKDALDILIENNVFFPVHHWRCSNCGFQNVRTADNLTYKNGCDICKSPYTLPLSDVFEWKYMVNEYVLDVLFNKDELLVLWALGRLHMHAHQSYYFEGELDLHYHESADSISNEMDIFCVVDGVFYIGEVKRSATSFLFKEREKEKFLSLIDKIKPNVALLVFKQYFHDTEDTNKEDVELALAAFQETFDLPKYKNVEFRCMIAEDDEDYMDYGLNYGGNDHRVHKLYRDIE